jgi:hypothetical protein
MKVLVPLVMDPLLGQTPGEAAESALKLLLAREYESITGALFLKIRKFKQIVAAAGKMEFTTCGPCLFQPLP